MRAFSHEIKWIKKAVIRVNSNMDPGLILEEHMTEFDSLSAIDIN